MSFRLGDLVVYNYKSGTINWPLVVGRIQKIESMPPPYDKQYAHVLWSTGALIVYGAHELVPLHQ